MPGARSRAGAVRVGLALALAAAGSLPACGVVHLGDGGQCLPSPLTVSPDHAAAGEAVTVSSREFACPSSYPAGKRYRLSLLPAGRGEPEPLGTVPVARNGSFRATLTVPADAPPGEAYVEVRGSAFDRCDDTEGGSCAGYGVPLTLLPPAS